jgi:hypothetical protein
VVDITKGGEEGVLLYLGLVEVNLLERLIVEPPMDLCLSKVYSRLPLCRSSDSRTC